MSFDTRRKIVTVEEARTVAPAAVAFVSHMEVLQREHVDRLEALAAGNPGTLVVILTEPENPLASLQARAEVTAALRVVDYVIPAPEGAAAALSALRPKLVVEDEEEDRGRTRRLIEYVQNRSRV